MVENVEKPRLWFFTLIIALLIVCYVVLVLSNHEGEAKQIGELLSLVVIAVVSYYLGYGKRHITTISNNKLSIKKFGHVTRKILYNLAYFMWGVGVALFVQHIIVHGFDFEPSELLLGHEYIGLYCIIAGTICYYWQKRLSAKIKVSLA